MKLFTFPHRNTPPHAVLLKYFNKLLRYVDVTSSSSRKTFQYISGPCAVQLVDILNRCLLKKYTRYMYTFLFRSVSLCGGIIKISLMFVQGMKYGVFKGKSFERNRARVKKRKGKYFTRTFRGVFSTFIVS